MDFLNFKISFPFEKIIIDQALVTSGHRGDYRIVAKSSGFSQSELDRIYEKSLPPTFFDPNIRFNDSIRVINVSEDRIGICYVTLAGRDEFNRFGRLRSHILVLDKEIYDLIPDPLFFRDYFISKDVSGDLEKISIDKKIFFENVLKYYDEIIIPEINRVHEHIPEVIMINVLSALIRRKKVVFYGGKAINITSISKKDKPNHSIDYLRKIIFVLPSMLKSNIEYSTYSTHYLSDSVDIVFTELLPSLTKEKEALIVDLEENKLYNKVVDPVIKRYIKRLYSYIGKGWGTLFLSYSNGFIKNFVNLFKLGNDKKEISQHIRDLLELGQIAVNLLFGEE